MKGLRSTKSQGKASDGLAKLSLNQRAVSLLSDDAPNGASKGSSKGTPKGASKQVKTTAGAKGRGPNATGASNDEKPKSKKKGKARDSVVEATAAAARTAQQTDNDEDLGEIADRKAEQSAIATAQRGVERSVKSTAKGVRSGSQLMTRAVKSGIVSAQKRKAAAKATKGTLQAGRSVGRLAAAQARIATAAVNIVRTVAIAVTTAVTSAKLITIVSVVLAAILLILTILAFFAPASESSCDMDTGGVIDPDKVPETSIAGYGTDALVNAAYIMQAGQDRELSARDQTIGVMTAMGESSLQVLEYGDAAGPDSRGLFQQRDSWGTLDDRLDPYTSAGKFFDALIQKVPENERESLAPTLVAHKVQVNADPYHYERYWEPATAVVSALSGVESDSLGTSSICETTTLVTGEVGVDGWAKPANGPITSQHGPRPVIHTPAGPTKPWHDGIDFNADGCGGPIWAARDGVVEDVSHDRFTINHGEGISTVYAHSWPEDMFVTKGQKVKAGEQVAKTGSNGFSTGCHLHFEIRVNGEIVDPMPILSAAGINI